MYLRHILAETHRDDTLELEAHLTRVKILEYDHSVFLISIDENHDFDATYNTR